MSDLPEFKPQNGEGESLASCLGVLLMLWKKDLYGREFPEAKSVEEVACCR